MFSLWFSPTGRLATVLGDRIRALAEQHAAPVFNPHVTLLGDIAVDESTVLEKASFLARRLPKMTIRFVGVGYSDSYFRCLFLQAEVTPELIAAKIEAESLFSLPHEKFIPHFSLLYGHFSQQTKEAIATQPRNEGDSSFRVRTLDVYFTKGAPADWHAVATFPMSSGQASTRP